MSMRVIIADNDWHFASHVEEFLESHAHLVIRQNNAEDLANCVEHWQPDLVILAAELAEKSVLEFLTTLRPSPAVLLTEHMDRYDRAWRAWQIGGDELLMKPIFRLLDLHEAIVAAMENAAAGTRIRPAVAASA